MSLSTARQRTIKTLNSLADWAAIFDDDDFDDLMTVIPTRCGSKQAYSTFIQQRFIIPMLEPGRPEFLMDEYEQVKYRYRAIDDCITREAFLEERQQLVMRIEEVGPVFPAYIDPCRCICIAARQVVYSMGGCQNPCSLR
jgi:hypothetical protein